MKYILVLFVVMFAVWLWRHNRSRALRDAPPPVPPSPSSSVVPQQMVVCRHCGVHLPMEDALRGTAEGKYYCGSAHRLLGDAEAEGGK